MPSKDQRGFTIVEVVMVVFIIAILSFAIFPSITAIERSQKAMGFRNALESVAQKARNEAIHNNRATQLKFDTEGRIGWDYAEEAVTESQTANAPDIELGAVRDPVDPTPTTEFTGYQLANDSVSKSDWLVGFYPDGSADRAYLEFTMDGQTFVLAVNPESGSSAVVQSTIDDQEETQWKAGEVERRVG
ncbi:MAG: GspH/FimT family pseudopilin [Armatimonadetes bacterium]|nr:GspH/FimT family pseudopilin [Armatimonadota bacterium]MBS1711775.1 GspH/FimT family pseudopilin [Armatimonadota bacterium]MBX3109671.1 GspH/FimT family pseudopilin [Fimbriimonadaceae bacterium]